MKSFLQTLILFTLLALTACGSDSKNSTPGEPPVSTICVTPVDQFDDPMLDCFFDYEGERESDICGEDVLFVAELDSELPTEEEGPLKIFAECGTLAGHLYVDIDEGVNDPIETYLEGSLCYRIEERVMTPDYPRVYLDNTIGFSSSRRCQDWILDDRRDESNMEIVEIEMVACPDEGNCHPIDARDYVRILSKNGDYSNGHPAHLTVVLREDAPEISSDMTIYVTVRELSPHNQEMRIPITLSPN